MKRPQPWIPKLPYATEEAPPEIIDLYPNPPLTEEEKKWPVVPLSKMMNAKPKPKSKPITEETPSDPS